jgi:hypothetical protein
MVKQEEVAISRQWRGKYVSAATKQQTSTEELLEVVFSTQSMLRKYSEDQQQKLVSWRLKPMVSSQS